MEGLRAADTEGEATSGSVAPKLAKLDFPNGSEDLGSAALSSFYFQDTPPKDQARLAAYHMEGHV